MANITRFIPLDDVPDADARGAGVFLFDDGSQMVSEDPELAQLVKSYQDELPRLEAANQPDQRLASNDPIGAIFGDNPFGDGGAPAPEALAFADSQRQERADLKASFAVKGEHPPPGLPPAQEPSAPAPEGIDVPVPLGAPAAPTDAQNAAELHRIAAQQALRGTRVAPQSEGYAPVQRTGAIPEDMAKRQLDERDAAIESVISATEQQAANEAEELRKAGLHQAMQLAVQREDAERQTREAEEKRKRLLEDRRKINDAGIDDEYQKGNVAAKVLGVLGAALLGAVGSDAGLRMMENWIDRHVRTQIQVRGSKLQALSEELGSEEEVIAAAKAKLYEIAEKQLGVQQKYLDAAGIEHKAATIRPLMRQRAIDEAQAQERENLGKVTEQYREARAGGFTGPDLSAAAKHYEAAAKATEQPKQAAHEAAKQQGLSQLRRLRDTLKRGQQSGDLAKVVGLIDKPVSETQREIGALAPGQLEQLTTLEELQVSNLMRLVREPNNKKTQDMVQTIGQPKSDREIDVALRRLDQLIELEESAPVSMPQPVQVR